MTDQLTSPESEKTTAETTNGRNPIIIFAGFLLLGTALALILFGSDLFGGKQNNVPVVNDTSQTTVLDQVSEFPTPQSSVAEIPSGSSGSTSEVGQKALNFTLNDFDSRENALLHYKKVGQRNLPTITLNGQNQH